MIKIKKIILLLGDKMKKFYYVFISLLVIGICSRFVYLRFYKHDMYVEEYLKVKNKYIYGETAPRGRIMDRNGRILVDNIGVNTVIYHHMSNNDVYDIAGEISEIIELREEASIDELKEFYMLNNETDFLLTDEEKDLLAHRKLTLKESEDLKRERLDEYITYSEEESRLIHLYFLMNKGYIYSSKILFKDVDDKVCALINESNIPGLSCEYTTKRVYLYDSMNALYGTVGSISKENKDYYLSKGYSLSDEVGLSYLEKEYDDYLKGEKALYKVNDDNTLSLVKNSRNGNDLVLTIDIDLQLKINEIIKNNIALSKTLKNTDYYNSSYVIVSDPNTGEILASTGLMNVNDTYYDVTQNILTSSFTVGSVIKGASHTVGYQNNLIEVGKKINDSCVKLYQVPMKCSYKKLGLIDDVTALKTSSNYYQFINAIKLTGQKYSANMVLDVNEDFFNVYRDTFAQFGLGVSTGIDLENESLGIRGKTVAADLLLNLSIGQYDAYTPLQLTNYINTIATSGIRNSLHYLKEVRNGDKKVFEYEVKELNKFTDNWFFERIKEGFRQVLYEGTGRGYTDISYKPAGKTGTSEIVYKDGVTTINQSYAMFAPYDNPKYSIVVLSPNISYNNDRDNYIAPINRYISKQVSELVLANLV